MGLRGESVQWRKKVQEKREGLLVGGLICLGGCFWWWCGWWWAAFMVEEEEAGVLAGKRERERWEC